MNRYRYIDENREHLHLLDEKPLIGTSSVVSVLAKNLTWWAAETSAVECLEVGEKIPTIREEYLAACASSDKKKAIDELQIKYPIFKKARFAHFSDKNKKADKGTDLHAELEKYVKLMIIDQGGIPHEINGGHENPKVETFIQWAKENVKKFLWSEMYCYSESLWVGGISDCGYESKDGQIGIIDFKSSKEAYDSQFIQIAGYDLQVRENGGFDKDGNKMLEPVEANHYIVFPFGAEKLEAVSKFNVEELREGFKSALTLHKLLNK